MEIVSLPHSFLHTQKKNPNEANKQQQKSHITIVHQESIAMYSLIQCILCALVRLYIFSDLLLIAVASKRACIRCISFVIVQDPLHD